MAHKAIRADQTVSQRARQRATESRLRAIYHKPTKAEHGWYTVHNLRTGRKYKVWYQIHGNYPGWVCECQAGRAHQRCKHVQRVLDREEQRVKQEALVEAQLPRIETDSMGTFDNTEWH